MFINKPSRVQYVVAGGVDIYPFEFKWFDETDIKVYRTPVGQVANDEDDILDPINYTITSNASKVGGSVEITIAVTNGDVVTISRALPFTRTVDFVKRGSFTAKTINDDQDYQSYLLQDLEALSNSYLQLPVSSVTEGLLFPAPEASKVIGWSASGTELENKTIGEDEVIINIVNVDKYSDLVTVDKTLHETVNIRGYHTLGDGAGGIYNLIGLDWVRQNRENMSAVMLGADFNLISDIDTIINTPLDDDSIIFDGYDSVNDDGGGRFIYDSSLSTTNNGVTIFNGWVRQNVDVINVKYAGAKGDGTTDDTTAFTNAGKGAYVPDGDFIVDATINPNDYFGDGSVREVGQVSRILGRTKNIFKKRIIHEFPVRFIGYAEVIVAEGYEILFPQGMAIHKNELYIIYGGANPSNVGIGSYVVVYNIETGVQITSFDLNIATYGEGIVVKEEGAVRYLYARHSTNTIGKWDITTLPAEQAGITVDSTFDIGLNSFFTWNDASDTFTVQKANDDASISARHKFIKYDSDFNFKSNVNLSRQDVWTLDANYIDDGLKGQGFTHYNGGYAVGYGATYIKGTSSNVADTSGLALFSPDGVKVANGNIDPAKFIDILEDELGVSIDLIECEALAEYKNALYGLYVTRSHSYTGSESGLLFMQELVGDIDCSNIATEERLSIDNVVKEGIIDYRTSGIHNPITDVVFNTLEEVFVYMFQANITTYGFYTTGSTITDINSNVFPSGSFVKIDTGNYYSFSVEVLATNVSYKLWISGGFGSFTQTDPIVSIGNTFTPTGNNNLVVLGSGGGKLATSRNTTASASHHEFWNPNGVVGTIACSASSTAYNTTSDERLKDVKGLPTDSLELIRQANESGAIAMAKFKKDEDGVPYRPMFIAQKIDEVLYGVTTQGNDKKVGEKDFIPWSVDESKAVPILMNAVYELTKMVEELQEKLKG